MMAFAFAVAVALSGSPTKAATRTQLKIEIKPATAVLYVDGKRKGTGEKVHVLNVTPGNHTIRVVHDKDEHQEVVSVKKGKVKIWQWAFEDDREDRKRAAEEQKKEEAAFEPAREEVTDPDMK